MLTSSRNIAAGIAITVIGGFVLAMLVSKCKQFNEMHETYIIEHKTPTPLPREKLNE